MVVLFEFCMIFFLVKMVSQVIQAKHLKF